MGAAAVKPVLLQVTEIPSPPGPIVFACRGEALCALCFKEYWPVLIRELKRRFGSFDIRPDPDGGEPGRALRRYFKGNFDALDDVRVHTAGTPFQERVWANLRKIPAGRTLSYAELAKSIGRPSAVRAVGGANGRNPVSIVVPCHRVIAADGTLGGYGGGLERKRWLLVHEGAILA
ncbi:MAG: methylated-DNA--[protein]-cysteine S-methyltransferase [Thermoanaerobaculia bacterium]